MALQKGAKLLFDWLGEQRAGTVVTYDAVMSATNWAEVSLRTYINKNKVAPFLQRLPGRKLKILLDGDDITEQFFNETFTQTAPRPITLVSGQTLHGRKGGYTLVEHIDNGAVGHVWSARATSGSMLVAAKVMLPRQDLLRSSQLPNVRRRFRREARYGETFEHPNVIRYLDSGDVEKNPFLIMELAESSVADRLARSKPISEGQSAEIVAGCIAGLCFLHEQTCVHRDVKPANILECASTTKLGDLGIVRWSDFDPAFTRGGTITHDSVRLGSLLYSAPEQQESPHDVFAAADIYSLGVTWIEMLTGRVPSPQAVGARAYALPALHNGVSELIHDMCSYDPLRRPASSDVQEAVRRAYGGAR